MAVHTYGRDTRVNSTCAIGASVSASAEIPTPIKI